MQITKIKKIKPILDVISIQNYFVIQLLKIVKI